MFSGPIFCKGCEHLKVAPVPMNMPGYISYYCELEHCYLENKNLTEEEDK